MTRLSEIFRNVAGAEIVGTDDPEILSIVADSREARPGALFAALAGSRDDGAAHVGEAIRRGAAAVLMSSSASPFPPEPAVIAADVRKALGEALDNFHGRPSQSLDLLGVTGTNGKTTTAYLVRHVFNAVGRRCGMLGTIEYDLGDKLEPAPLTTPDAVRFTRALAEMRDSGCRAAVVEASSHALDQDRVWPHRFSAAIFTNLSRDHLDYHGDMETYLRAKRLLFTRLDDKAIAVVNLRDPAGARMAEGIRARVIGYRLEDGGGPEGGRGDAVVAKIVASDISGQSFRVVGGGLDREFRTPLVGGHNVENCLGVILSAIGMGVDERAAADAVADFPGVPGRLERIVSRSGATAFVDYSHTPGALRSALSVLRPLVGGKLIAVFGCGGDRDKGKRPLMAKAAEELADRVVVTSDNPRTEDPEAIIRDIMAGFSRPERIGVDADRPGAVRMAVAMADPGDAILVAGKGHENYQIIGAEKRHMDDRELVREAFGIDA